MNNLLCICLIKSAMIRIANMFTAVKTRRLHVAESERPRSVAI